MRRSIPVAKFPGTARGEGRQKIAGSDEPVRLHEGGCHFISADRHREAVAERPRPLKLRTRDVREPVGLPRNLCTQSNCRKDAALTRRFRLSISPGNRPFLEVTRREATPRREHPARGYIHALAPRNSGSRYGRTHSRSGAIEGSDMKL